MSVKTLIATDIAASAFPAAEVKSRLKTELEKIADEGSIIRPEWEPLLDSLQVVGVVLVLEEMLGFRIPPDKVVRRGGYNSVDEAIEDMLNSIEPIWIERKAKVRK